MHFALLWYLPDQGGWLGLANCDDIDGPCPMEQVRIQGWVLSTDGSDLPGDCD